MIEIETFELVYQIFWLVLVVGGAVFILTLIWSLHTENKRREKEKKKKYKESNDKSKGL